MKLVLICKTFPYGKGEEFISDELKVLAGKFEVLVIPSRVNGTRLRSIPQNVEVRPITYPSKFRVLKHWKLIFSSVPVVLKESFKAYRPFRAFFSFLFYSVRAKIVKRSFEPLIDSQSIFYTYWTDENALACAMLNKEKDDFRYVSRGHGHDLYHDRSPFNYLPFREFIYGHCRCALPISRHGYDYLSQQGVEEHKLHLASLGVPVSSKPMPKALSKERLHILSCSYISPVKRITKIIEVISHLNQQNIKWTHIGGGEGIEVFRDLAGEKLSCPFEFTGDLSNAQIHEFYQNNAITFLINLSLSEGIPVTMMEAISYGVPIVSNDVGGVSEIVNTRTGLLVDKNDTPEKIAELISKFEFPNSSDVRDFHLENYNSEKNYSELCTFLKQVS